MYDNIYKQKGRIPAYVPFIPLMIVTFALVIVSLGEKRLFTTDAYSSPLMLALWCITAISTTAALSGRKVHARHIATSMIHIAFILILVGAAVSHFCAEQSEIHLRLKNDTVDNNCEQENLPVKLSGIELKDFIIDYYPGTSTPMNFTSILSFDGNEIRISMNKTATVRGYKLLQSQFDSDNKGIVLKCTSDRTGTLITFIGYILLGLSFIFYFREPESIFRIALLKVRQTAPLLLLTVIFNCNYISARDISPEQRHDFMRLMVMHNNRITTLSTLAADFTSTITGGRHSMNGMDADDIFRTFLFDFGSIKGVRLIKTGNKELRQLLGITERYASYDDYIMAIQQGKIDIEDNETVRKWADDIARFEAINMLVSGELLKVFPYKNGNAVYWISPTDAILHDRALDSDRWIFIRKGLGYLNESVLKGDTAMAGEIIRGIRNYQIKESGICFPGWRVKLERFYTRHASGHTLMIICLAGGLMIFIISTSGRDKNPIIRGCCQTTSIVSVIWLCALFSMRWIISGHVPLANGFETMQFMALALLLAASTFGWKNRMLCASGMFAAGLALAVAAMSGPARMVGNLMPVLSSPLLSIHVLLVMMAYSLLILLMLNGLSGLLTSDGEKREYLMWIGRVMLYPAVFLLAAGIFVGAVWADVSWGTFWSWDPKETWALITLLIYSFSLHPGSLEKFNKPHFFHLYMIFAFLSVIVTYFGVNFYLGGMHSYA